MMGLRGTTIHLKLLGHRHGDPLSHQYYLAEFVGGASCCSLAPDRVGVILLNQR